MNDGYKRCKCRDDADRELGAGCPRLKRSDDSWNPAHGTWYGKTDLPPAKDGGRITLRQGGFATQKEMQAWFDGALALLAIPEGGPDGCDARAEILGLIRESRQRKAALPGYDDIRRRYTEGAAFRPGTTGDYLVSWLDAHEAAENWSASTLHGYRRVVQRLFLPAFGNVPLDKLRAGHVLKMLAAIDEESDRIREARESADPEARASVRGRVPAGAATKRRYLAVLRSALADAAAPESRLITSNVAAGIRVGKGGRKTIVRAKLWTAAREQAWREEYEARLAAAGNPGPTEAFRIWRNTAARPFRVMVWLPGHAGQFLDAAEEDRLYNMFVVMLHNGLRRGEAVGLPLTEIDLEAGTLAITSQITLAGWKPVTGEPKTYASDGTVHLEDIGVAALRAERKRQLAERISWGPAYQNTGLAFTREDGSAYHPGYVGNKFERMAFHAGLPPISIHGTRHVTAVLALASGADIKVVSALLRHSSVQITADIYADVLPDLAKETAAKVARMIPRKGRRSEAV